MWDLVTRGLSATVSHDTKYRVQPTRMLSPRQPNMTGGAATENERIFLNTRIN